MSKIRILNKENVQKTLDMNSVIESTKGVYTLKSEGKTVVWPTTFYEFDPGHADMDIKSGYLPGMGIFGHKTVSFMKANRQKHIPDLLGAIVVFDSVTGELKGVIDGGYITGMRTGAAGAIGAKYLAKEDSENLLILGAGNQAAFQIAATLTLFKGIKKVRVADVLFPENAEKFVDHIESRLSDEFHMGVTGVSFEAVSELGEAVSDSDIIITVTPSRKPVIKKDWVKPGTHFSCIGSDASGKEEIDPEIFVGARIYVDDKMHCVDAGEIEIPLKKGLISEEDIQGEIGDLILGKTAGRASAEEITIFDATGMALLDLAAAKTALDAAEENALGDCAEF